MPRRFSETVKANLVFCVWSCEVFFLLEWYFVVTSYSFLSDLPLVEWLGGLAFLLVVPTAVLIVANLLLWKAGAGSKGVAVFPAFLLTLTIVTGVDNFFYTLFGVGLSSAQSNIRVLFSIPFLFVFWLVWRDIQRFSDLLSKARYRKTVFRGTAVMLILPFLILVFRAAAKERIDLHFPAAAPKITPNILLISADGLEANRTSLYGAKLNNTPFLRELAKESLVFENVFTNGNRTAASVPTVVTGKNACTISKYSSKQILLGRDSYEHLPGVLKHHDYRCFQIGMRLQTDANDWNLRQGFDVVNLRGRGVLGHVFDRMGPRWVSETYLLDRSLVRARARLSHVFGGPRMEQLKFGGRSHDAFKSDDERVDTILATLEKEPGPIFVQMHLNNTHATKYNKKGTEEEMGALYNKGIVEVDHYFQRIVSRLKELGKWDNTVLIFWSDHGMLYHADQRLPLLMKFPKNPGSVNVARNAQNIDIAPTILDYIGLEIPGWMEGRSLLRFRRRDDPIFCTWAIGQTPRDMYLTICNETYRLEIPANSIERYPVKGHTEPCPLDALPTTRQAKQMIATHLQERNFKSDIRAELPLETIHLMQE